MKCRACWSDKAYTREVKGWRGVALSWLGLVPLKCHHCYHRFSVLRLLTIGQQMTPPVRRMPSAPPQLSIVGTSHHETLHPQRADSRPAAGATPRRKTA